MTEKSRELGAGGWLPLESNPALLNSFHKKMGVKKGYAWGDVYGLEDEMLEFVPKPVIAVGTFLKRKRYISKTLYLHILSLYLYLSPFVPSYEEQCGIQKQAG